MDQLPYLVASEGAGRRCTVHLLYPCVTFSYRVFVLSFEREYALDVFWGLMGQDIDQRNEANNFDAKALWVHFLDPRRKMRHKAVDLRRKIAHSIHHQIISQLVGLICDSL